MSDMNGPTSAEPIEFPNLYAPTTTMNTMTPGRRSRWSHPVTNSAGDGRHSRATASASRPGRERPTRNQTGTVTANNMTDMATKSVRHPAIEKSQSNPPPPTIMPIR